MTASHKFIPLSRARQASWLVAVLVAAALATVALVVASLSPAPAGAQDTMFTPDITVRAPWIDSNDDNINDLGGATVTATYREVASPAQHANCTDMATETFTVASGANAGSPSVGAVVDRGDPPRMLVNLPAGGTDGTDNCRYEVDFTDSLSQASNGPFAIERGDGEEFTAADSVVTVYSNDAVFFPVFDIRLGDVRNSGGTASLFTGARFELAMTLGANVPPMGCTEALTETLVAGDDGTVTTAHSSGLGPMWVDVVDGEISPCVYRIEFPETVEEPTGGEDFELTVISATTPSTEQIRGPGHQNFNEYALREYRRTGTTELQLDIFLYGSAGGGAPVTVPVGTQYEIMIAPESGAHELCSIARTRVATMTGDGSAPAGQRMVDSPLGTPDRCSYVITWPTDEIGDTAYYPRLSTETDPTTTASHSLTEPQARYGAAANAPSTFIPDINVRVPYIDDSGINALNDASFYADFTPVVSPQQHRGCTQNVRQWYDARASGSLSAGGIARPTGTTFALVDLPSGGTAGTDNCVYQAVFVEGWSRAGNGPYAVERQPGPFSAAMPSPVAVYSNDTVFFPNIDINVTQVMGTDDTTTSNVDESMQNLFTGATFDLDIAATSTSPASGCTADTSHTFEVQPDGTVTAQDNPPMWVSLPGGTGSTRCAYTVTFPQDVAEAPSSPAWTLRRIGASGQDIDDEARVLREYRRDGTTDFSANVTINTTDVPAGTPFAVALAQAASQHVGCSVARDVVVSAGSSGPGVAGVAVSLVDTPFGEAGGCEYVLTWPTNEVDGTMYSRDPAEVSVTTATITPGSTSATANFIGRNDTFFDATVDITVPTVTDDQGSSIFQGATIGVTFARASGGSDDGCSADRTLMFTMNDDGGAETDGSLNFVNVPDGETACVYSVTFDGTAAPAAGTTPMWTLTDQGTDMGSVSDASKSVARTYASASDFTFEAPIAITVPDVDGLTAGESLFAGSTFSVSVMPVSGAHAGCVAPSAPATFTVQANDSVTGTGPTLVDVPAGQTDGCSYDWTVTAPTPAASATLGWTLAEGTKTPAFGGGFSTVAVVYTVGVVTFVPDVTIEVPQYNADDDPATQLDESQQNAFTGVEISADFERTAGPATGCGPVNKIYVVAASGAVEPLDGNDAVLPHYPDGDTSAACEYSVAYSPNPGTDPLLGVDSSDTSTQASDLATNVVYVGESTFAAPVTVVVPFVDANGDSANDLDGQTVTLAYEPVAAPPQHARCSTGLSDMFTIGAGADPNNPALGVVTPPATPVELVDRPRGVTDRCTYTADASDAVTPTGGDAVAIAAGSDNQQFTNGGSPVPIRYSGDTFFSVTVSISVPANAAGVTTSPYAGTSFVVSFERSGGPAANCSTGVSVTHTVQANGSVTGGAASLVDVPDGETASCEYSATFPVSRDSAQGATPVWGLRVDGAATEAVSPSSASATRAYVDSYFTATVSITVPANEAGVTMSPYAGTSFAVPLERSGGPATGCSTGVSVTLTVADDASVADATAQLRDVPPDATGSCVYAAAFPSLVSSAPGVDESWTLRVSGGGAVSAATPSVTGVYAPRSAGLPPPVGTTPVAPGAAPTISVSSATGSGVGSDIGDDDDEGDEFSGFVPSVTQRVPISVSLALPSVSFEADATIELLVSAPGACGSDMAAFGGVPAQVGLAYAISATSGAMVDVIAAPGAASGTTADGGAAAGARHLAAFARRGTQQEPCALRVTLLAAPAGCSLTGATTDVAGRSYTELTWRDGTDALALTPSLTCGDTTPEPASAPAPDPSAPSDTTPADPSAPSDSTPADPAAPSDTTPAPTDEPAADEATDPTTS